MTRLLTPAELADYLQVTEATLADFRYRGRGPKFFKVGRLVRYKQEDVDDWLAASSAKRYASTAQISGQSSIRSSRRSQFDDPLALREAVAGIGHPGRTQPPGEGDHDGA